MIYVIPNIATTSIPPITKTADIKFIAKSYFGVIEDPDTVSVATVSALTALEKNINKGITKIFNATYGRFVWAFPASLGNINSVKDMVNNINYTDSVTKKTMTIDSRRGK